MAAVGGVTRVVDGVARVCRAVTPYATWATCAIQLGYFGYNLYNLYQQYLIQEERDAREGRQRSLDEAIHYVVRPRRRRFLEGSNDSSNRPATEQNPVGPTQPVLISAIESNDDAIEAINAHHGTDTHLIDDKENSFIPGTSESSPEVTIVYDSLTDRQQSINETAVNETEVDEDVMSTTTSGSTSIESTDSNNGIVKDIYSQCFICANDLDNPNKSVATLPFCLHPFHKSCLDSVLKWHHRCPVCDYHIFSPI